MIKSILKANIRFNKFYVTILGLIFHLNIFYLLPKSFNPFLFSLMMGMHGEMGVKNKTRRLLKMIPRSFKL